MMQTSVAAQIEAILRANDHFPLEAVRELVSRREDAVAPLLELLENAVRNPDAASKPEYMGHIYAAMLLASFRERRAHPLLIESLSAADEHDLDMVWGGMMVEYMPRLLAMTAGPDVSGLMALADDEKRPELVRELAIEALGCLVARGEQPREPFIILLRRLLSRPRSKRDSEFVTFIAMIAADIHPGELVDDLSMQITAGIIDEEYFTTDELNLMAAEPVEKILQLTSESVSMRFFDDVVEEMSGWDCFNPEQAEINAAEQRDALRNFFRPPPDLPEYDEELRDIEEIEDAVISRPGPGARPARGPEAGRNEPCPCGSGKKYKKCCGQGS
ncbi:MAG TPA: DUF1186 domain-containing protein [Candidatus Ozemobacteraceae bacterium]|nr:DUF1186 domain-containing protein [Candidatus Ozemobacteraceae bacterium]